MAMSFFLKSESKSVMPKFSMIYKQSENLPLKPEERELLENIPQKETLELKEIHLNFNDTIPDIQVLDVDEMFG